MPLDARWRLASVVLTLAFLALLVTEQARPAEPRGPTASPPPAAISVAEIATRAAGVSNLLRSLTPPPSPQIETIAKTLPEVQSKIALDLAASESILRGQPTMDMLQAQQLIWQRWHLVTSQWLGVLTQRATLLQSALYRLAETRKTWLETRDAAQASGAPDLLLEQVNTSLAAVASTETALESQRVAILALQSAVAKEVDRSEAKLAQFTQAQEQAVEGILTREAPPVWSAGAWARAWVGGPAGIREGTADRWADIARYLRDPSQNMLLHVGIFALLIVAMFAARRRARQWETSPDGVSPAIAVLAHPIEGAVGIALLIVAAPNSPLPPTVRNLLSILGLGAVIRLVRLTAGSRFAPECYMLWLLFAVNTFRASITGAPVIEQGILILEMVGGIGVLAYSLAIGGLRQVPSPVGEAGRLAAYRAGARLLVLLLGVALVAGAVGYMRLARLLASGVLGSGALALMLYASVLVVTGLVAFALRTWPLRTFQMVQHHRDLLERRMRTVLRWLAIIGWAARVLNYMGLFALAWSLGQTVLFTEVGRGPIQISLADILGFLVTVWLAYLASAFIRFVLEEDVYPRTRMKRGMTYAVSSLLNYIIIALGFVLALGALGMDLSKVTILAGAFGVGIGFGLQSVVNNFVSGLILLFERPVHVGDVVEIGDHLSGEVSRIGIRASTVRTYQGAEIIVPNAQLITERVTNWTLSDRTRRIDLRVGVDYGSAPEKVLQVLEGVARANPGVLKSPAPSAFFIEFGDSAITFELRAWTSQFERWGRIQTELAVAIYAALHEAGMSIPFPQREVRVLRDGGRDREPAGRAEERDVAGGPG
ncbi:MAG TPA: mechanosensitive ion channel domain-containing protein [Candidatus Methylomirabilis sp.]|nr:mechanosensitive ion channel domain-containing protein [Candidatus Methylomirabilis sp.]